MLIRKGYKDRVTIPVVAKIMIDGGEFDAEGHFKGAFAEHRFQASYRKSSVAEQESRYRKAMEDIRKAREKSEQGAADAGLSDQTIYSIKRELVTELLTGWDLGTDYFEEEGGGPVAFTLENLAAVLDHREYLDALHEGAVRVLQGAEALAAKNS